MKHKSRAEKDRRYAVSTRGVARRRRYDRSAKGRARTRRWRKSQKGRRAIHRYNASVKGQAKRERSLAKVRPGQPSGRATAVPERETRAPAMRERAVRRLMARDFTGAHRGNAGGAGSGAPRSADELLGRYHGLKGKR